MTYFWAMRPIMGLFAVGLCLAGFRLQAEFVHFHQWQIIICATLTFLTCGLAMLWNDYADRDRDVLKGKRLAHDNPDQFFRVAQILGVVIGLIIGFLIVIGPLITGITLIVAALSLYYSMSYRIVILPTAIVALCSASPSLYGFLVHPQEAQRTVVLFLITFLVIGAREILKDIEDMSSDVGYKATLPLRLGVGRSRIIATLLIWLAALLALWSWRATPLVWASVLLVVIGIVIWSSPRPKAAKISLDITTLLVLLAIVLGYLEP